MLCVYVYFMFHSTQIEIVTSVMDFILSNAIPASRIFCPLALFKVQLSLLCFNSATAIIV